MQLASKFSLVLMLIFSFNSFAAFEPSPGSGFERVSNWRQTLADAQKKAEERPPALEPAGEDGEGQPSPTDLLAKGVRRMKIEKLSPEHVLKEEREKQEREKQEKVKLALSSSKFASASERAFKDGGGKLSAAELFSRAVDILIMEVTQADEEHGLREVREKQEREKREKAQKEADNDEVGTAGFLPAA